MAVWKTRTFWRQKMDARQSCEHRSTAVGILGWSHGGMITLMNIFEHPTDYKVAYAGVPVSDLVARMGYKGAVTRIFSRLTIISARRRSTM